MTIGTDISFWNGTMNWQKMRDTGAEFVIIKVSQGKMVDAKWAENKATCDFAYKGGYHFLDYENYTRGTEVEFGQMQAVKFCQLMDGWTDTLPGALDLESYWYKVEPEIARVTKIALAFVNQYYVIRGHYPMMYLNSSLAGYKSLGLTGYTYAFKNFLKCPLWVANYNNITRPPTGAWSDFAIWQYSSGGDGLTYGNEAGNLYIDLNKTTKPLDDLCWRLPDTPTPPAEPTDAEKLARLWDAHPEIH